MASKRKKNPNQPELPIEALPDNTPGVVNAAPLPKGGNGEAPNPKSPERARANAAPYSTSRPLERSSAAAAYRLASRAFPKKASRTAAPALYVAALSPL